MTAMYIPNSAMRACLQPPAAKPAIATHLKTRYLDLDAYYYALLYGSTGMEDMAFSSTQGILFSSAEPSQVYFKTRGACYRCARAAHPGTMPTPTYSLMCTACATGCKPAD
jgi:hypothetical protein